LQSLRAVLFDLDGTLVHSPIDFPAMRRAVVEAAEAYGADAGPFTGLDALAIVDAVAAQLQDPEAFRAASERALTRIELEACGRAEAAPGAAELLEWLEGKGIRVGIVTRNSRVAVERILSMAPLAHRVLLTRHDTPRVKPDPVHLLLALERLEADAAEAAMVGDHPMDVLAGRRAGMRTVGILAPGRPDEQFDAVAPDLVIRRLDELRAWISPS
jgi:phosphoglycolate phosphatase